MSLAVHVARGASVTHVERAVSMARMRGASCRIAALAAMVGWRDPVTMISTTTTTMRTPSATVRDVVERTLVTCRLADGHTRSARRANRGRISVGVHGSTRGRQQLVLQCPGLLEPQ